MYKHQKPVCAIRDSWQEVPNDAAVTSQASPIGVGRRRSSDPITIFSAAATDHDTSHNGIFPSHVGGVFVGQGSDELSSIPHALKCTGRSVQKGGSVTEKSSLGSGTSLGLALEEVLESVDQATIQHQRTRSDSRIQDWLGQQSEILSERKRKCSIEEQKRIKGLTEKIMRDLLRVDKSVLDILFRTRSTTREVEVKATKELEARIWKRWIELTERDTADLRSTLSPKQSDATLASPSTNTIPKRTQGLEKIPWGVPEDSKDEAYWDEELSVAMVFKYLKSCMNRQKTRRESMDATDASDSAQHTKKHLKTTQTSSNLAQSTVTGSSTMHTLSTIGPRPSLARLSKTSRNNVLNQNDRARSRTSKSSSYRSYSIRTGTCSVASVRRSALGSNFWDLGSIGGGSINSREVGGPWSVYA